MRTPDELRALLDAMPRPRLLSYVVQIIAYTAETGADQAWITAESPAEAILMLQYMDDTPV